MSGLIGTKTPAGLFEFCDTMISQGYLTASAADPWKTATKKILETVCGEAEFEQLDLGSIDLEDAVARFRTKTLGSYKEDSINAYARRMSNAVEAYLAYVENGKTPETRRPRAASNKPAAAKPAAPTQAAAPTPAAAVPQPEGELIAFPFPLKSGEMAQLHLPRELQPEDAERLTAFVNVLRSEPQKRLAERTGDEHAEAA
jgi:hypothetical protein